MSSSKLSINEPAQNLDGWPLSYNRYFIVIIKAWLVVWVLWHINLCMLFNVNSIFMKIVLFQTIQFSICMQFKCKYSLLDWTE